MEIELKHLLSENEALQSQLGEAGEIQKTMLRDFREAPPCCACTMHITHAPTHMGPHACR